MIQYVPNRKGVMYLIHALLTPMEKKAHMALQAAKNRCKNEGCTHYAEYGGRGISVCDRWSASFQHFVDDVGLPPGPEYSIERIDVNGNYEPGNVKWALLKEQHRNRRNTRWVDVGHGKKMPMADAARMAGVSIATISLRLRLGWKCKRLLAGPWGNAQHGSDDKITVNGVTKTAEEWADHIGISRVGFRYRIEQGLKGAALIAPTQNRDETICINGVRKTIPEWAATVPMDSSAFRRRLRRGETGQDLLRPPTKGKRLSD